MEAEEEESVILKWGGGRANIALALTWQVQWSVPNPQPAPLVHPPVMPLIPEEDRSDMRLGVVLVSFLDVDSGRC